MELSEKQIARLKKLSKFVEDKDISTIENFIELDEKIDDVKEHLDSKFTNLQEELKKKLESELVLEIDKEELKGDDGYTPVKGVDYFDGKDGKDGKNYVLTNLDKKQIAKSIEVPVVEKVIEKTEVIRETPIVTEIVKEVALKDSGEDIILKINEDETSFIKKEKIKDFDKAEQGILDRAVSIVDNRTSFLINKVSNLSQRVDNIPPVDLSGYVPYTGATSNVTLGSYDLTANNLTSDYDLMAGLLDTTSIATPANGAYNIASGSYQVGAADFSYKVYAYKTVNSQRIFSSTPTNITWADPYVNEPPMNIYGSDVAGIGRTYYTYGPYSSSSRIHTLTVYAYKTIDGTDYIACQNTYNYYDSGYPPYGTYDIQWSWSTVAGCDGYYAILNDGDLGAADNYYIQLVGEGNNSFTDSGLSTYTYGYPSVYSNPNVAIELSWDAVAGAEGYYVWFDTPATAGYGQYYVTATNSLTDDSEVLTLQNGTMYSLMANTDAYASVHNMYGSLRTNELDFYGLPYILGNGIYYLNFRDDNTLIGEGAGTLMDETSTNNTLIGNNAGDSLTLNNYNNTAIGNNAMTAAVTGSNGNTAIGYFAGGQMTNSTSFNVFIGAFSGQTFKTGNNNLFLGYNAGPSAGVNTSCNSNIAIGAGALRGVTSGSSNVGIGEQALYPMTTGQNNFAAGYASLRSLTTGSYNFAAGSSAGFSFTAASFTMSLGYYSNYLSNTTDVRGGAYFPMDTGEYKTAIGPHSISQFNKTLVLGGPQNTNFVAKVGFGHTAPLYGVSVGSGDVLVADNTYADLGADKIQSGTFSASTGWTLGTGWAITGGKLSKNANGVGTASQTSANMTTPLVVGEIYELNFYAEAVTSGGFYVSCAGVNLTPLNSISIASRYTFVFKALTTDDLTFSPILNTDRYNIDNVQLRKVTKGDVNVAGRVTHQGAYAEIYVADNVTAQSIPTGATYTKITAFATNGQSSNCTADQTNDKITITKGGKYLVTGMIDVAIDTANTRLDLAVFAGGTIQPNIKSYVEFPNANVDQEITITGILNVSANTDIDLRAKHDDAGSVNVTPENASLVVTYLGE